MSDEIARLKFALADRYTIEREIGAGGMAVVYLAQDLKHKRKVALKVLRQELAAAVGSVRFVREIEIAAKLSHPHILPLYDSGEADGILYYVMPYVDGESLRERLDRVGKIPIAEAVRLTDEIASALSYAHEQGIVHRDIKPENIMLSGGRAVVADFGIARAVSAAGGTRLTGTGFAVGTPAYMSPEQAFGDSSVDRRSDVYALGCVVYEMVSGRAPFEAETPQALLAKHAADTVPSLRTSDPAIPLFLERAVERTLAKDPKDRFQTAAEFAEALTSELVVARVGKRRWTRLAVPVPATVVVFAAAVWGYLTFQGGPTYERLAVLPPTNLMNDPEQDYFVEGLHEALIDELQRAGVPVIARRSVLQYQNTQKPISEIASELRVDALIESSVFRAGDSVEMKVRLVDGATEQYVADPITRGGQLRNVITLYRNLSGAIAAEIHAALTPQAEAHLSSARPVDPQVYEAFLKGQSHLRRMTPADLDRALEYFQQALLLDSTYTPAQARIALVWVARAALWLVPPREAAAHKNEAIRRALALDSTLPEVQYILAMVRHQEWDFEGAEAAIRKAIEINPNLAAARQIYATYLNAMERPYEARAQIDRALLLDFYNPAVRVTNGILLCDEGRYAECTEEYQAALRIEPGYATALLNLAWAYHVNGNYDEALTQVRRWFPGDQELDGALDHGYAEGGYRTAMRRYAETLAARPGSAGQLGIVVATVFGWAGEKERTLEWLERAYQAHDPTLPSNLMLTAHPELQDDPRFIDLRRRVNLPY